MHKAEIGWRRLDEEGERVQLFARRIGTVWRFFIRRRRFDQWAPLEQPPLDDWFELLDAVRRRVQRRLLRPEEIHRVEQSIRQRYPEVAIPDEVA